jgi:hypothetical protein
MKVLLTNNQLAQLSGTETWLITMARELARRHEVFVFTHEKGYAAGLLAEFVTDTPPHCDLALINHNTCLHVKATVKICTSHGIYHPLERPLPGSDLHVAVSEEIARTFGIETIIRNPIDTSEFRSRADIGEAPRKALAIVSPPALEKVREACSALDIEVLTPRRDAYDSADLINQADIVFSLGRGALEAMSCGRAVIVYDERSYTRGSEGYLSDQCVRECNYSGRYFGREFHVAALMEEIKKYRREDGARNRAYIEQEHAVERVVDRYLTVASDFLQLSAVGTRRTRPMSPASPNASIIIWHRGGSSEAHLQNCLQSALNQTYDGVEVILAAEEEIASVSDMIRVQTSVEAWNAGFARSRGNVVIFLDSADALFPMAVQRTIERLSDPAVVKVHWHLWEIDEGGCKTGNVLPRNVLPDGDLRERTSIEGPFKNQWPPLAGHGWRREFLKTVFPLPATALSLESLLFELPPRVGVVRRILDPQGYVRRGNRCTVPLTLHEESDADAEVYLHSCAIVAEEWRSRGLDPQPAQWKARWWSFRRTLAACDIAAVIADNEPLILVDDGLFGSELLPGHRSKPLIERDGEYWGAPNDDREALTALQRQIEKGAKFIVFVWPSFWWLDYYSEFSQHLNVNYDRVLHNDRAIGFSLQPMRGK